MAKKLSKRFLVKDSGLVLDLVTGRNFTLNATGLTIFRGFIAGLSVDELLDELCREFAVDRKVAQRDLDEFMNDLRVFGIDESR